ncbi:MAG TPA: four helix bundle protein [Planctomycetota bacterium]
MKTTSFTQLNVWQTAHRVAVAIYKLTRGYPADERYGLSSQMRRAAVSVPAIIAEGFARRTPKDKGRFYLIARSSAEELKYFLILSRDLAYASPEPLESLARDLESVCRMLHRLLEVNGAPDDL